MCLCPLFHFIYELLFCLLCCQCVKKRKGEKASLFDTSLAIKFVRQVTSSENFIGCFIVKILIDIGKFCGISSCFFSINKYLLCGLPKGFISQQVYIKVEFHFTICKRFY